MSRRFPAMAAAMAMAALPAAALADKSGYYIGLGAGIVLTGDADVSGHRNQDYATSLDAQASVDAGNAFRGAVGYAFGNGLRVEGELSYRRNGLDELDVAEPGSLEALARRQAFQQTGIPWEQLPPAQQEAIRNGLRRKHAVSGDIAATTLMANVHYDLDVGGIWRPYVAAGVGVARLEASATATDTGQELVDDDDAVLAYQIGGGVGYEISGPGLPAVVLSLDYRLYGTTEPTFTGSVTRTPFETEQNGHYLGVGIRFGF